MRYIVLSRRAPHNSFPVGGGWGGPAHLRAIARMEPVLFSLVASAFNRTGHFRHPNENHKRASFGPLAV